MDLKQRIRRDTQLVAGDDEYFLEAAERLPPEASEAIPPKPQGIKVHHLATLAGMVLHELARLDGRDDHLDLYESRLRDALARYREARTSKPDDGPPTPSNSSTSCPVIAGRGASPGGFTVWPTVPPSCRRMTSPSP